MVGNVGDSRAVLATRDEDDSLIAVQLTVDLKPSVPGTKLGSLRDTSCAYLYTHTHTHKKSYLQCFSKLMLVFFFFLLFLIIAFMNPVYKHF